MKEKFRNQAEGVRYFLLVILNAANRGAFGDEVFTALEKAVDFKESEPPSASGLWQWTGEPIVAFLRAIMTDSSMHTDFLCSVRCIGKHSHVLIGTLRWTGQWTEGRFIEIRFTEDGQAEVEYNVGNSRDSDHPEYSSFLGLGKLPTDKDIINRLPWRDQGEIEKTSVAYGSRRPRPMSE